MGDACIEKFLALQQIRERGLVGCIVRVGPDRWSIEREKLLIQARQLHVVHLEVGQSVRVKEPWLDIVHIHIPVVGPSGPNGYDPLRYRRRRGGSGSRNSCVLPQTLDQQFLRPFWPLVQGYLLSASLSNSLMLV